MRTMAALRMLSPATTIAAPTSATAAGLALSPSSSWRTKYSSKASAMARQYCGDKRKAACASENFHAECASML